MKTVLYFLLGMLVLTSCASTKTASKAPTPAGQWDYTITGTPEGDFVGVMTITEVDKNLTAKMVSSGSELIIEKFVFDKETKKVSGELDYSGTLVLFDGVLAGEQMDGAMSAGGMSFPFKATRKK